MPYKVIGHTADLGIVVWGLSKKELFTEAARALFTEIAGSLDGIEEKEKREIKVEGETDEELLVNWLSELLFLHDAHDLLFARFEIKIDENRLSGVAYGEKFSPERHKMQIEIKAVTYHNLEIKRTEKGWEAQIIFDI